MFPLNIGYYNASPWTTSVFILLTDSERSFFYNKKHWLFRVEAHLYATVYENFTYKDTPGNVLIRSLATKWLSSET